MEGQTKAEGEEQGGERLLVINLTVCIDTYTQ